MKFENVRVRESVKVIDVGVEKWKTFETNVILEEGDTFEDARDAGVQKIQAAHDKYSQSFVEPSGKPSGDLYFNVTKNKEERI
jgi:hypothetical protein